MVDPLIVPDVAVIREGPASSAVATPEVLIVATVSVPEAQVTEEVRSLVEPSVLRPVAVNVRILFPAKLTDGFAGATVMDAKGAVCTVRVVVPVTPPEVAVIVAVPAATPLAKPEVLIVAVASEEDVHTGARTLVLPSL